jgi:hypothetical protein
MLEVISKVRTGLEIATLADAEIYFRSEESGGIEDSLIEELITAAREEIEELANISLVENDIVIYAEEWSGFLPYPRVNAITTPDITFTGSKMPYVEIVDGIEIAYSTLGRESKQLKAAVLELAFHWYKRGDDDLNIPIRVQRVIDSESMRRGL